VCRVAGNEDCPEARVPAIIVFINNFCIYSNGLFAFLFFGLQKSNLKNWKRLIMRDKGSSTSYGFASGSRERRKPQSSASRPSSVDHQSYELELGIGSGNNGVASSSPEHDALYADNRYNFRDAFPQQSTQTDAVETSTP
jgi:hypothetical protein